MEEDLERERCETCSARSKASGSFGFHRRCGIPATSGLSGDRSWFIQRRGLNRKETLIWPTSGHVLGEQDETLRLIERQAGQDLLQDTALSYVTFTNPSVGRTEKGLRFASLVCNNRCRILHWACSSVSDHHFFVVVIYARRL